MPTVKDLREYIRNNPKAGCPQPSLGGNKAELLRKAKLLGYVDRSAPKYTKAKAEARKKELAELKRKSDKIKAIRKRQAKTTKTPAVITVKPTKAQQAAIDQKKQIKTFWKAKLKKVPKSKQKVSRSAKAPKPLWGSKSKTIRKGLEGARF
jgi:hypothetical protein